MKFRNIFYWLLYDFANSISMIAFFLYFSQWLVVDRNVSDLWFNLIFVASSILLLLTAPLLGSLADSRGHLMPFLRIATISSYVFFGLTALITNLWPQLVLLASLSFLFANYSYLLSFGFYNPLLRSLGPQSRWGLISGIGQSCNWLGQIVGLVITLPFAKGATFLFEAAGRQQTFLPATLIYLLLSLPMLLFFKEESLANMDCISLRDSAKQQFRQTKELLAIPGMGIFLLAYFFYNDAFITTANNFPIYLNQVFNIGDELKSYVLIGILMTSAVGGIACGWLADHIGFKRTLVLSLLGASVLFPLIPLQTNFVVFNCALVGFGVLYGSILTVSRALLTELCPANRQTLAFSFYCIFERFATLVGPLTWGLIISLFSHLGPTRYRLALLGMSIFMILGLAIARHLQISLSSQTNRLP